MLRACRRQCRHARFVLWRDAVTSPRLPLASRPNAAAMPAWRAMLRRHIYSLMLLLMPLLRDAHIERAEFRHFTPPPRATRSAQHARGAERAHARVEFMPRAL